ncbi:MAG: DbpA RNA binding domain-containing protein [Treponema sp.]|jgi:hypothetical protein|nr:DbpA RNA binding domain-containing protein [Treponema sp.]
MKKGTEKSRLDRDKASKNMKVILDKMYGSTDLSLLSEYRKIYKNEISLFRRSWAAAWLFMYYDQREAPGLRNVEKQRVYDGGKSRAPDEKPQSVSTSADSENFLPEEESKRLFISIGKNRRLYPREVITFIMSKTSTAREDIGSIRILDNYSFVQVRDTKADEIIETLNGMKFRGRTLTVNFAKPRSEVDENRSEGNSPKQEQN